MLDELSRKVVEADKDPEIRCIVLTGSGRGFCSGLDLIDTNDRRDSEVKDAEGNQSAGNNRPVRKLFDLRDAPINVMWLRYTDLLRCQRRCSRLWHGYDITLRYTHHV